MSSEALLICVSP